MILHVKCTRKCTRKTGSIVRHEAFNIVLCFLVVLRFFLFDGVLIRRFQHIVCGVSHALHGVFVRNTNGQHSGGIDVAEVVETEVWDTAFLADAGEPGVDRFPGHVDNAVSAAGLPVQQFPDVGRDMERSRPAVCFCAFLGGAILSQNDCPTDFQSVAINVPPFQT